MLFFNNDIPKCISLSLICALSIALLKQDETSNNVTRSCSKSMATIDTRYQQYAPILQYRGLVPLLYYTHIIGTTSVPSFYRFIEASHANNQVVEELRLEMTIVTIIHYHIDHSQLGEVVINNCKSLVVYYPFESYTISDGDCNNIPSPNLIIFHNDFYIISMMTLSR